LSNARINFAGEMIFRSLFEDHVELRKMKKVAKGLAYHVWPPLYDIEVLSNNTVPVYAATYMDDMYVDFELAQETAKTIRNIRQWVTNFHMHDGLRQAPETVLKSLFELRKGPIE